VYYALFLNSVFPVDFRFVVTPLEFPSKVKRKLVPFIFTVKKGTYLFSLFFSNSPNSTVLKFYGTVI
jgi:hypothetical protein